jgi:hypothetical protein
MSDIASEPRKAESQRSAKLAGRFDWERWDILYLLLALGGSFLSGIADRFGLYTGRNCNFAGFVAYTAKVNSFMPAWTIPVLAWAAIAAEFSFVSLSC